MSKQIQNIKGMPDLLPHQTSVWQYLEQMISELLTGYGYREIRLPVVEYTDLFKRSIGEVTDIVEKEMYTFTDRNGEWLTLRPEGTAGCVRAATQNGLLANQAQQRLWYQGPMFRYEKPQKGRQRQFHQLGVEAFGIATPDMDAELILLAYRLWQKLGLADYVTLELNSIGSLAARNAYKAELVAFLSAHKAELDEDSQRRLDSNPLRILDSKLPQTQALLDDAPNLHDYLDDDSREHSHQLCYLLDQLKIPYRINPRLVRGLDYYNKTVFEWVTTHLGAQGTVCAGGRYDGLVEQLGGKATPAVGFAIGLERLTLLIEAAGQLPADHQQADIYFVIAGDEAVQGQAFVIAEQLRSALPGLKMITHTGGGSFKSQMKKADKSGAALALVVGSNEMIDKVVAVKPLREGFGGEQELVNVAELPARVQQVLKNKA